MASIFQHGVASGDPLPDRVILWTRLTASKPVAVECTSANITAQNFDEKMKWPPRTQSIRYEQELLLCFPEMKYLDLDSHGYNIVDVTPARILIEWWNMATVLHRNNKEWRGAAFQILSGSPALLPAP